MTPAEYCRMGEIDDVEGGGEGGVCEETVEDQCGEYGEPHTDL